MSLKMQLIKFLQFFHVKTLAVSLIFSAIWIIGTDFIVHHFFAAYDTQFLQTAKGLLYIFILSMIVSLLKQREQVVIQELFAQKKQAMIGEFSSMIVHEVKNPLHTISLGVSRLEMEFPSDKTMGFIKDAVFDLNETITFLQSLSKGETNQKLELEEQDLSFVVTRVVEFLKNTSMNRKVDIQIEIPEGQKVIGSKGLLFHLFLNLIKNAVESFEEEDSLPPHWIKVSSTLKEKKLIVSVTNSGKKIGVLDQTKLFHHYTTKAGDKGTGLGLLICRQVMEAHKGKISYDSSAETPSFLLEFPRSN